MSSHDNVYKAVIYNALVIGNTVTRALILGKADFNCSVLSSALSLWSSWDF